jgi:hypothetical protein
MASSLATKGLITLSAMILLLGYTSVVQAAPVKKPVPPARITYTKGLTPTFLGDYPNGSMQINVKDKIYTLNAPGAGTAVSNVFVPVHPKNKDLVYVSTMAVSGKNTPTSLVYEYNLKSRKVKQIFSEKNPARKLRIVGIDGNNLVLAQAKQAIGGGCSSLWTGQYTFVALDIQKPKTVKAYPVSAALKKLGESEEQACKQSFEFR